MKPPHHEVIKKDLEAIQRELEQKTHFAAPFSLPPFWQFIIGLGIIILLISLILVSYPIDNIIRGQLESTPLQANTLIVDGYEITFSKDVLAHLQEIYSQEQKVEFSVCLLGKVNNQHYEITSLYQPRMYRQTFNHVSFEPCSQDTIVMLHSHPYKSCVASQTDLQTLQKTKERNPDTLMLVMCEPERFAVYESLR